VRHLGSAATPTWGGVLQGNVSSMRRGFIAALVALAAIAASCGDDDSADSADSAGSSAGSETGAASATGDTAASADTGSTTLHLAVAYPELPLDPASYGGGPGTGLLAGMYQRLLQYKPESSEIVGDVASSWDVSPDGLTYTFTLRDDQIFHDGSPVTADAFKFTFERHISLGLSAALSSVASVAAPDPHTLVVTLKQPDRVFLHKMASTGAAGYVVNPAIVQANAGSDQGQTYLANHDAGSGPYELVSFGEDAIVLKAFPDYPGPKPYFTDVEMRVITNVQTQILQLQQGQLDALSYSIPAQTIDQLAHDPNFQVKLSGAPQQAFIWINPQSAAFGTPEARAALSKAIDREALIANAFPTIGTAAKNFYPFGMLPDGMSPVDTTLDTSAFESMADSLGHFDLSYLTYNAQDQLAAENLQIQLQALGADVALKPFDTNSVDDLINNPDSRPDLLIVSTNAEGASPDGWVQLYMHKGGIYNLLGVDVPEADALVDAAKIELNDDVANQDYAQAGQLYLDQIIPIADIAAYVVAQKSIGNITPDISNSFGVNIQQLTRTG
jgi:peptide/nickel transport system substrate-binding protein